MPDQRTLYPLRFFVRRTPISLGGHSKSLRRWRDAVNHAAKVRARETDDIGLLDDRPVSVTIFYFPRTPMDGDIDNIVKPILDAMNTVAYIDDRLVERVTAQKFEPGADWFIDDPDAQLAAALDGEKPVVYVRVDDDLSWRTL